MRRSLTFIIIIAGALSARADETTKRLANGVDVVVVPQQGAARITTKVAVVVAYRAGARDETRDEAGIAHLAERLHARAATETFLPGETEKTLERFGYTRSETLHALTYFASVVPEEELRLPLEIERQRLLTLAPSQETFAVEKARIASEILKVEVSVIPRAWNAGLALAFGEHGLGRPRVGLQESIEKTSLEKALAWRRARYRPDSTLVVIAGATDPAASIAAVESALGAIARPEAPLPPTLPVPPPATSLLRVSIEARTLAEREVLFAYRGPDAGAPDEGAFLALAFHLRERLDRALRGEARSLTLHADPRSPDPDLLVVTATPHAKKELAALEARILEEIGKVRDVPPGDARRLAARVELQLAALTAPLERRLARLRADGLDDALIEAAADRAIADPLIARRAALVESLSTLSPADLKAAAARYLAEANARVVSADAAK
jgi:predicted Zn-dependent peptidase